MKKIVSVFLASALAVSACAGLAGCSGDNKNYPVSVADITIETEPKDIVVLSDETADIISYLGYAPGSSSSIRLKYARCFQPRCPAITQFVFCPPTGSEVPPSTAAPKSIC